ncbi:alpha/beta hydrolase [Caenispirillum salinarum]|uniref:alpha/beta hydrolase n=1 Tax=Caenispirillum salinarum TaxID=859058 RepID=UPI00384CC728
MVNRRARGKSQRRRLPAAAVAVCAALSVAACAGGGPPPPDPAARLEAARRLAAAAGLAEEVIPAGRFSLTAFHRLTRPGAPVRVYVEGDGLAWLSRRRLSGDPSPVDPVALRLAAADPAANVAYLARPCQFGGVARDTACRGDRRYWSSHRHGADVVAAVDAAVDALVRRTRGAGVELAGFSGGGAVAVLVAGRRDDVAALRTVAGALDNAMIARLHNVTPLRGSLDPADSAAAVAAVPQLHVSGAADAIVPPVVAEAFIAHQGAAACAARRVVPGAAHTSGWAASWPDLLTVPLPCAGAD